MCITPAILHVIEYSLRCSKMGLSFLGIFITSSPGLNSESSCMYLITLYCSLASVNIIM